MELELAQSLLSNFGFKESIVSFKRVESGLINSTFVLNSKTNSYILQSINTNVFPNYEKGLENILTVGNWLKKKNYSYSFPLPIKSEYLKVENSKTIFLSKNLKRLLKSLVMKEDQELFLM